MFYGSCWVARICHRAVEIYHLLTFDFTQTPLRRSKMRPVHMWKQNHALDLARDWTKSVKLVVYATGSLPKLAGIQEETLQLHHNSHFTPRAFCHLSRELLSGCPKFMSNCVIKWAIRCSACEKLKISFRKISSKTSPSPPPPALVTGMAGRRDQGKVVVMIWWCWFGLTGQTVVVTFQTLWES